MKQGRDDKATRALEYLHHTKQIKTQVEAEKNITGGFLHIPWTPSHRKRALCGIFP